MLHSIEDIFAMSRDPNLFTEVLKIKAQPSLLDCLITWKNVVAFADDRYDNQVIAAFALWRAIFSGYNNIVFICRDNSSLEFFKSSVEKLILDNEEIFGPLTRSLNKLSFQNGSNILFRLPKTNSMKGLTASVVFILGPLNKSTEAQKLELLQQLIPMVNCKIIICTSKEDLMLPLLRNWIKVGII